MKKSTEIANDIFEKHGGALLSVADVMTYCGIGRDSAHELLKELVPRDQGCKKCYWYKDIAEAMSKRIAL